MTKDIDILCIGDIVTDAFIRLEEAEVHCELDKTNCKLCVNFGEKIPYQSVDVCVAVGNSANAAVSASRLGLSSALLSYVGDDQNGTECIAELQKNGVITDYVRIEAGKKTNYHYVLWYDVDRTILIKHEAFSYSLGDITPPKWIYLSSLGSNTLAFHDDIANFIETHPETKLAFQPGTFQIKTGKDRLARLYRESDIFFCNVEEAQKILEESSRDPKNLLAKMHDLGPAIVCITDGINGAYAFDGNQYFFMPVYPHNPFERTGAGDAFASTVVSALALGKPLHEALTWGPINSQSVVQYIGAQKGLLPREKLEDLLAHAPEGYKIAEI